MLKPKNRLKSKEDFDTVFRKGRFYGADSLSARIMPNKLSDTRIGLSIGTKYSPLAVDRNRIKRQIRAFFSRNLDDMQKGYDIVVMAKKQGKADMPSDVVDRELGQITRTAKILNK